MLRTVFYSIVLTVILLPGFTVLAEDTETMPVYVRTNVAHRGASYLAPENTLLAYKIAISAGADAGECDVWQTTDGVLFLTHETKTGRRLASGDGRDVRELKFDDLKTLDAGFWKGKQFKGEKVPTFEEYLEVLKGTTCYPFIHIKQVGVEEQLVELLRKHGMVEGTTVTAGGQSIKKLRELEPKLCLCFCTMFKKKEGETAGQWARRLDEEIPKACRAAGTNIIHMEHSPVDEAMVRSLQKDGIRLWCWIVNDPRRMEQLLDWGVESITTDRPELLTEILKKRKP